MTKKSAETVILAALRNHPEGVNSTKLFAEISQTHALSPGTLTGMLAYLVKKRVVRYVGKSPCACCGMATIKYKLSAGI